MRVRCIRRALLACALVVAAASGGVQPALATHDQSKVKIQLKPESATNTVGQQHCVEATVRDPGHGNQAVVGATVHFRVSGANTASGASVTNASGEATFCYTGTRAGNDLIAAFLDRNGNAQLDAGEPSATATKTYVAAAPKTLTLDPLAAENTAGTEHCVTATVRDEFGNPTPGIVVRFTVTGANPRVQAVTTSTSGQATFCYTGTSAGTDAITAFADTDKDGQHDAGEPGGAATKVYAPLLPGMVTLSPPAAENTVGDEHCVTATVTNTLGGPSAGVKVVFTVSGANPVAATTRTTNAQGEATFCYTGTNVGLDTIRAFADNDGDGVQDSDEKFATATKLYKPGAPASVTVEPPSAENVVGTQHCVLATVRDAFLNPTPDVLVRFAASGANAATGTDETDANGTATFCYTGTRAGLDTITAHADTNRNGVQDTGEPTGTATKLYHPGEPARVDVSPAAATNVVGEEHCVTATVTDVFGNPTPDVTVFFTVEGTAGQRDVSSGTDRTDATGQATFCYTAELPGEDVITAVADADGDGEPEATEPRGAATKTYVLPPSTPGCEITITGGGWIVTVAGSKGTFGGNAKVDLEGKLSGELEYHDHGLQPLNVHSVEVLAIVCSQERTEATIYGTANVNGAGPVPFRVRVKDSGEPGVADRYGIITPVYASGDQPLQGGNIQVR